MIFGAATAGWVLAQFDGESAIPRRVTVVVALVCATASVDIVVQNRIHL